jgi:hypothetical protein
MKQTHIILTLTLSLLLAGCSQIVTKVEQLAGNDLQRTSELAAKYGKPEVKQCADFMLAQVAKLQSADSSLANLQAEPTNGLFSAALKAALIADALRTLQSVNGPDFKADFKTACSAVAGDVLFNVMQDAAKLGKRGV